MKQPSKTNLFAIIGPGLLVAATGIGAGDLATASFAGSILGTAILWAAVVGAFLKFVVTEGLARWQLATGDTLLEGIIHRIGKVVGWLFLPYLFVWSFFVASALMSACGVTLHAMIPVFEDATQGKIVFGALSSVVGVGLVLIGGYELFDKIMRVCIGLMFVTVLVTAGLLWPGTGEVLRGLFVPSIPDIGGQGLTWTVALLGGIGGTFTVLCYGYWIREEGRSGGEHLRTCRIDLGTGYAMTALFGIAMVIIGTTIEIEGRGATLLVSLSDQLVEPLGQAGKWIFLIGAAGAVFSSLLGVWRKRREAGSDRHTGSALPRLPLRTRVHSDARPVRALPGNPETLCGHRRDVHPVPGHCITRPERTIGLGRQGIPQPARDGGRPRRDACVLPVDRLANGGWLSSCFGQ
jgi:Mn2+/Fe2+ NRAMP family transporter